ncbi:MAG: LD-carboxypeptidase [Bacteroidetes bacterium]|nr:LD-carboxypeptidase [Bacteroidota bacterium]
MNRKDFLLSSSSLIAASQFNSLKDTLLAEDAVPQTIPAYLKKGDIIGITSPAGYITLDEIKPAIQIIERWGYKVKVGNTIGKRDFTFGGTDEERTDDFQQMLDDPKLKAILSARGGYGSIRIVDRLKWDKFKEKPKWIIGFSDLTVIHSFLNRQFGIASIHSKMCNSFPDDWSKAEPIQIECIESINKALSGEKMSYTALPNANNRQGIAEGKLVGGNLKTLETMSATQSDLITVNKILFVEDTGEYLYSIDRMFWNLKRTGKLTNLKGLIVGGFKVKTDAETEDFGKTVEQIVLEKIKNYKYPVCFDFPVGHQKNNFALKCGVRHLLKVNEGGATLNEMR